MSVKKIKVKDYYSILRGKSRIKKIPPEKRKEVAKKAAKARWSKKNGVE